MFGNVGKWIKGSVDITLQQEQAVQVKVLRGDILKSQCEVMINTTDNEFDLTSKFFTPKYVDWMDCCRK